VKLKIKRAFDLVVASSLLALFSPVMGVVAAWIRATIGKPVLFRQVRPGYQGTPFTMLKFRTMTDERDPSGRLLPDGERLTPVGRFLRSTTLDELPELINVVKGDMSLVGPRALLEEYRDLYTPEQWRRHQMPPGMAGPVLAQGRNALDWEEKFRLDVWYVDNWSLWLDLKILATTFWKVLRREGVNQPGQATVEYFRGSGR